MKKVLFISYHFPPIGASQRALKFVKFLPQFGWSPIILAPAKSNYPKIDKTMLSELPAECEVIRLNSCEEFPGNPYITIDDFMKGWFPETIMQGIRLIEKRNIDAIYSVSAPYVSLLSGLALKRLTGKPLVIDLRDEWTTNPFIQGRRYSKDISFNKKFEVLALKEADAVISVTKQITNSLFKISGSRSNKKFHTISNGYDSLDFANIVKTKKTKKFTICYMGSIYGLRRGVVDTFFQSLNTAITTKEIPASEVEINLVGYLDSIIFPKDWVLNQVINKTGYLDHHTTLTKASAADLLLLFIDPREDTTVTSKIYELIRMGKPILAIIPPNGPAADVIKETRTGIIIDSRFPSKAISVIQSLIRSWKADCIKANPNEDAIQNYDRKKLTGKLASILNQVTQ